jgi:hypothetical protein
MGMLDGAKTGVLKGGERILSGVLKDGERLFDQTAQGTGPVQQGLQQVWHRHHAASRMPSRLCRSTLTTHMLCGACISRSA